MTQNPATFLSDNYLVCDLEIDTARGDYGHSRYVDNAMLLACWATGSRGHILSARAAEYDQKRLLDDIRRADFLVAHNAKYELGWLERCGLDLYEKPVFDTMLAEYVLLGNLPSAFPGRYSLSLDSCARRRGWRGKDPVVDTLISHGINPVSLPSKWLLGRCRSDVDTTRRLFLDQRKHLTGSGRLAVLATRTLLTPVLVELEHTGLALDGGRVRKVTAEYRTQLQGLEERARGLAPGTNWNSPDQVARLVYDRLGFEEDRRRNGEPVRTNSGKRKADAKTLAGFKAKTEEQKEFLGVKKELGKIGSALSKNLNYFAGAVGSEDTGIIVADFNQSRTQTHRLSSSGVPTEFGSAQFQNLPRAFKPLFKARRDGWLIGDVDGSQLEFRVAAHLGSDARAISDIEDSEFDAHCLSGSELSLIPYSELLAGYRAGDKKLAAVRQAAKAETFKPLYGGEFGTKAQMRWYAAFKERYSGIARTQADWLAEVLLHKSLTTEWGMRYYWPYAKVDKNGRANCKTEVYNYPVQALATAEIIPIAVRSFRDRVAAAGLDDQVVLVNTVHDSVIAEVAPSAVDWFKNNARIAFTTDVYEYLERVYGIEFRVPLGVGIKVGTHWGEGAEESFNVYRDGTIQQLK